MLSKLRSYVRQQHIGLLALFIALGGSAYAASNLAPPNSVNSKAIINGQVKSPDIANGAVGPKALAPNAVTGANVKDGSITGAKIKHGSITGANIFGNSLTGANINESTLGTVPSASNAANAQNAVSAQNATNAENAANAQNATTVGGYGPGALGTEMIENSEQSADCAIYNWMVSCAPIEVTVPAGRKYSAIVWSSISGSQTGTSAFDLDFCPSVRPLGYPPENTAYCTDNGEGTFQDTISFAPGNSESGAATGVVDGWMGPGTWYLSTRTIALSPGAALSTNQSYAVHTAVLLTDASGPSLPGVCRLTNSNWGSGGYCGHPIDCSSGSSSGSSGQSSSGSSGGQSSSGSSGSSGQSSSGSSGSSGQSSSGSSGSSSGSGQSSSGSSGSSGQTSSGAGAGSTC
ncbi:MAG: hypothetical protein JOZ25_09260 [Actinobacteria bacterium]|nr:hypothetical protein [Actinomycetota bacterium]